MAIGAALLALNWFIYSSVGAFEFVNWDDPTYVLDNPRVLQGLSWSNVWWTFTTDHPPYWHPLTWLSHMLDVSLFGRDAGAHHLVNLWIHVVNSWLVFAIFRFSTRAIAPSAFAAAVFAVHPLHVESVAWVAERKDVLSTLFLLIAIFGYVLYARMGKRIHYAASLLAFALALMSKPMVVTLPVLLLLFDVWPLKRLSWNSGVDEWRRRVLEKAPMFVLAFAAAALTIIRQSQIGAMASVEALSLPSRAVNALVGYAWYVGLTFWPTGLAAFHPARVWPAMTTLMAVLAVAGVSAICFRVRRTHPYLLTGWLFFVVGLAPVIGLLQAGEQAIAERFTYVPMLGIAMAVAWGAASLAARREGLRLPLSVLGVALVMALTVAARNQASMWSDSVTLWERTIAATGGSSRAYENLAQAQRERGDLASAQSNYQRALDRAPANASRYHAIIRNAMGLTASRQGRVDEALQHLRLAVHSDARFAEARINLGNALASTGRNAEAEAEFREAVKLSPDLVEARLGLGSAVLRQGRHTEAVSHYQAAIALEPDLAEAHNGLGAALMVGGAVSEAIPRFQEALRLKPGLATAHLNLGLAHLRQGDVTAARREMERALSIDPGLTAARESLAFLDRAPRD